MLWFLPNLLPVIVRILDLPKMCQDSLRVVLPSILQLWLILSLPMM